MVDETARAVMQKLVARGLSPVQAAAFVGHGIQESGLNPNAFNPGEGAFGAIQWRLDRLDNLKRFANDRGAPHNNLDTQLDFALHEMRGREAKAGRAFLNSTDLPSAHAALKRYIRYGDNSDATRIAHASKLLGIAPPAAAPMQNAAAAAMPFGMAAPATPEAQQSQAAGLQAFAQALQRNAQDQDEPFEMMDIPHARPVGLSRVKELLAAMKRMGA
jgi:hypothetical protein